MTYIVHRDQQRFDNYLVEMNTTRLHASAENLSKDYLSPRKCLISMIFIFVVE